MVAGYDTAVEDSNITLYYSMNASKDITNLTNSHDHINDLETTLEPEAVDDGAQLDCSKNIMNMFKSHLNALSSTPTHKNSDTLDFMLTEKIPESGPHSTIVTTAIEDLSEANLTDNNDTKNSVIEKKPDTVIKRGKNDGNSESVNSLGEALVGDIENDINTEKDIINIPTIQISLASDADDKDCSNESAIKLIKKIDFVLKDDKENDCGNIPAPDIKNKRVDMVASPKLRKSILGNVAVGKGRKSFLPVGSERGKVRKSIMSTANEPKTRKSMLPSGNVRTRKSILNPVRNIDDNEKLLRNRKSLIPSNTGTRSVLRTSIGMRTVTTGISKVPTMKKSLSDIKEVTLKKRTPLVESATSRQSIMPVPATRPKIATTTSTVTLDKIKSKAGKTTEEVCDVCNKVFGSGMSLITHKRSHNTVKCKYCDKSFTKKTALDTHLKLHCDKIPVSARRLLESPQKQIVPRTASKRATPNKASNDDTNKMGLIEKQFSGIKRTMDKPIFCPCCNKYFNNILTYAEHDAKKNSVRTAIIFDKE